VATPVTLFSFDVVMDKHRRHPCDNARRTYHDKNHRKPINYPACHILSSFLSITFPPISTYSIFRIVIAPIGLSGSVSMWLIVLLLTPQRLANAPCDNPLIAL
jgi:hypothetical protein